MGVGSLFMDISSEMIHSLLPIFMVAVLGASMVTVGIIEGIAEATAATLKVFSGALSDYLGERKFLMILGYGLAVVGAAVGAAGSVVVPGPLGPQAAKTIAKAASRVSGSFSGARCSGGIAARAMARGSPSRTAR